MKRTPKIPTCEHYEMYNGNPVAVLFRVPGLNKTENCPFCGKSHKHGSDLDGNAHRNASCAELTTYTRDLVEVKLTPDLITASDGTILDRRNGYIIRNRPSKP